jgi:hypothetical protein
MKNITEKRLEKLGFQKVDVSKEEAGDDKGYYYYEYELSEEGRFALISSESDYEGEMHVQFFDHVGPKIFDYGILKQLVKVFKKIK